MDISKRVEAEESLRENEERLRLHFENTPLAVIEWGPDMRLARWSAEAERVFGWKAEEVLGMRMDEFRWIYDEDAPRVAEVSAGLVDGSHPRVVSHNRNYRKDGSLAECEWYSSALMDESGRLRSILSLVLDVTERNRRNERIAKLTRLYEVLSRANEAIVRARDMETLFSEACRIIAQIGEFPLVWIGEVQGRQVVPVARAGAAADYLDEIRVEIDGPLGAGPGGTCIRENRIVVNDDFARNPAIAPWRATALRYGFLASAAFPLRRGGKPMGELTIYARDAGAFDAEQVALLESLAADLSYAIDALDLEQRRNRAEERTRLLSEVTAELLASDQPQEIVETLCRKVMAHVGGQLFFYYIMDEQSGRLRLSACAGIPEEATRQIEWFDDDALRECIARDSCPLVPADDRATPSPLMGLLRHADVQAYACYPLTNQGQAIGTLSFGSRTKTAFAHDEQELMKTVADHVAIAMQRVRLLESLEEHARAAEAANVAKSDFLTNISHELRTPMNAILGMIDVAIPKAVHPTAIDCLKTAKGSADLLLTLLNDLLDSAKIELGKLELESAPFSLQRMLNQIARVLAVRASEKGLSFYCRLPNETPDAIVGDRMRLQQVLLNLAGNAIKFTERGKVEISVRCLSQAPEAHLEFAVRDTGIGLSEAARERLFQPFGQADASMSRRFGGTGLGLAISKNLVEMMGGRIWAESEVGAGSTFYFVVPEKATPDVFRYRSGGRPSGPARVRPH